VGAACYPEVPVLKTLDRYVIREILPPLFLSLLIFTFILEIPPVMEYLETLVAKGVPWGTAARIMLTLIPQALGLTIPMSLLVGLLIGLGGRIRIRPTVYVVGEIVPRVDGFDPGSTAASFALEKRVGGHAFQLVFSNTFGLTMAQIARGGIENSDGSDNWYMGFNISRKFF